METGSIGPIEVSNLQSNRHLGQILSWHADLLMDGLSDVKMLPSASEVITCNKGTLAGCIVFMVDPEDESIWIYLSFVHPPCRQLGVYRGMWTRLVQEAQERKIKTIIGGTHHSNKTMQEVMERTGRKLTFLNYQFEVPE